MIQQKKIQTQVKFCINLCNVRGLRKSFSNSFSFLSLVLFLAATGVQVKKKSSEFKFCVSRSLFCDVIFFI